MAYTTNDRLPKLRAEAVLMVRSGKSTREVARHFGYSQSAVSKWCKRAPKTYNPKEIETLSSRPKHSPNSLDEHVVARIIDTRVRTKRCAEVVHAHLRLDGVSVSLSSVKRTLDRYGMLKKRSVWKKKRKYPPRPDILKEGDLVQFDTIHFVNKDGIRSYVYTAIDVYSRNGYAMRSPKSNTHASIVFLKKVRRFFSFPISTIQTDNGSEFSVFFSDATARVGINHRHIHPRSPNENGHLERFNRTLQEEMPKHGLCIHCEKDIRKFLKHYNTKRLHMGINFKTPAQMLTK